MVTVCSVTDADSTDRIREGVICGSWVPSKLSSPIHTDSLVCCWAFTEVYKSPVKSNREAKKELVLERKKDMVGFIEDG